MDNQHYSCMEATTLWKIVIYTLCELSVLITTKPTYPCYKWKIFLLQQSQ